MPCPPFEQFPPSNFKYFSGVFSPGQQGSPSQETSGHTGLRERRTGFVSWFCLSVRVPRPWPLLRLKSRAPYVVTPSVLTRDPDCHLVPTIHNGSTGRSVYSTPLTPDVERKDTGLPGNLPTFRTPVLRYPYPSTPIFTWVLFSSFSISAPSLVLRPLEPCTVCFRRVGCVSCYLSSFSFLFSFFLSFISSSFSSLPLSSFPPFSPPFLLPPLQQ